MILIRNRDLGRRWCGPGHGDWVIAVRLAFAAIRRASSAVNTLACIASASLLRA
jgi:hypothetical protein